jgi:excisionase family DNA binding protein
MTTWDDDQPPILMTLQQASAYLGMPYMSVRKLVLDGDLLRVELGQSSRIWVKRADVDDLVNRSTKSGPREVRKYSNLHSRKTADGL